MAADEQPMSHVVGAWCNFLTPRGRMYWAPEPWPKYSISSLEARRVDIEASVGAGTVVCVHDTGRVDKRGCIVDCVFMRSPEGFRMLAPDERETEWPSELSWDFKMLSDMKSFV